MASDAFVQKLSTAVVIACLTLLAGTSVLLVSPKAREWVGIGPTAMPPEYSAGDRVDVPAVLYSGSPRTLLLFARSTCAACQRSSDFHQQAIAAARTAGIPVVLITPSTDLDAERAYAGRLGLNQSAVHHSAAGSIRLRAVPTLMIVEADGTIRHVWFGAPDSTTHTVILEAITGRSGMTGS